MSEETKRLHATVHGRVQGVGFRWFVMESARDIDITGWVRNRYNGTVEVVAEGCQEELAKLEKALNQGPRSSNVTRVDAHYHQATGEFPGFKVKLDG